MQNKRNRGAGDAPAPRNQLGRWLQEIPTQKRLREQQIRGRFRMSRWLAKDVADICYGEAAND